MYTMAYAYVTAVLNKCMEVLYIQHMKVLLYNQVYSTKIFIFPAGGESPAPAPRGGEVSCAPWGRRRLVRSGRRGRDAASLQRWRGRVVGYNVALNGCKVSQNASNLQNHAGKPACWLVAGKY